MGFRKDNKISGFAKRGNRGRVGFFNHLVVELSVRA